MTDPTYDYQLTSLSFKDHFRGYFFLPPTTSLCWLAVTAFINLVSNCSETSLKKKKKKNSLYATAPAPRVRVSYALEHSPTRQPVFLRSLWGQTEHKVNIVFIISRPETGLHCKLRWHLVNLPKPGLRERSFWLSRCVPVSEICWVGFYCFFELSENATFPDFAVT